MPAAETATPAKSGSGGSSKKQGGGGGASDTSVAQLMDVFPDWTADELQLVLDDKNGDIDAAMIAIVEGHASRWENVSQEKTKKPATKPEDAKAASAAPEKPAAAAAPGTGISGSGTPPPPNANGIPARGGFRGARGGGMVGRGGRGGARGGRGGIALANGHAARPPRPISVPAEGSEESAPADPPAPAPATTEAPADGWSGAAAGEPVAAARKPPQKPVGAIGAKPAAGQQRPAAAAKAAPAPAPAPSSTPAESKSSWAQIAKPKPEPPKPAPVPVAAAPAAPSAPAPAAAAPAATAASATATPSESRDQSPAKPTAASIAAAAAANGPPGLANKAPAPQQPQQRTAASVVAGTGSAGQTPTKRPVKQDAAVVMPTVQSNIKENLEALGVRFGSLGVQSPTEAKAPVAVAEPEPVAVVEEQVVPDTVEAEPEEVVQEAPKVEKIEAAVQASQPSNGPLAVEEKATVVPEAAFQQQLDLASLGTGVSQPQLYSNLNGLGAGGVWPNVNPAFNDYLASMTTMYGAFQNQGAASMTQTPEMQLAALNSMRAMMGYYDPSTYAQAPAAMPAATQQGRQQNQLAPGRPGDALQGRYGAAGGVADGSAAFGAQTTSPATPAMTQAQQQAAAFPAQAAPGSAAGQLGGMPFYQQPYFYPQPVQQFGYPAAGANQASLNAYNQRGYGMYSGAQGGAGQAPGQGNGPAGNKSQNNQQSAYYGYGGFGPESGAQTGSQMNDYNKNWGGQAGFGGFAGQQDQGLGMGQQQQGGKQLGGYKGGYDSQMSGGNQRNSGGQQSGYYQSQQGQSGYGNQGYYQGGRSQGYANWNQQN